MNIILPQKLIIDIQDGGLQRATLLYRINSDGVLSPSKSVKVTLDETTAASILAEAEASAKTSEGL